MEGKETYGIMLWFEYEEEWHFIAQVFNIFLGFSARYSRCSKIILYPLQVSVSAMLNDVKIDPMRGECKNNETAVEAATRELYEESCGLFDLRNLASTDLKIVDDGIFHLRAVFEDSSSSNPVTPTSLINYYRDNRRARGGCREILDLAVEPINSRQGHQNTYPRLARQAEEIVFKPMENMADIPSIRLHRVSDSKLTTFRKEDLELSLQFKDDGELYHPLLLDRLAWESWIIDHDRNRLAKLEKKCLVSREDSSYRFLDKTTGTCRLVMSDKVQNSFTQALACSC